MRAFLFPGQGSQHPGMGKALTEAYPAAKAVFDEADEALGLHLSKICFDGSEEDLRQTEITQPAILTHSIATLRALLSERPDLKADFAAGHSLGEWSALVAVGALSFGDAVRLVRERGRLMQVAVPKGQGAMAAILGLSAEQVTQVCEAAALSEQDAAWPANFNSPEQIVISGSAAAVQAAQDALTEAGAKKVVPLPVSAPFHCPMMQPAADGLKAALEPVEVGDMTAPIISNVEATANSDSSRVKDLLVQQVTHPVRWVQCFKQLVELGATSSLELGPGKVLMGLGRRIDRGLSVLPLGDPAGLTKALTRLE